MASASPPLAVTDGVQNWLEYALEPLTDNNFPLADQVSGTVYLGKCSSTSYAKQHTALLECQ